MTVQVNIFQLKFLKYKDGYGLDDNILRKLLKYFTDEELILAQQEFTMYFELHHC
jgi:hypothetical protein